MKPSDYDRHVRGDGKRFHVRIHGQLWEVYGLGLDHICMCTSMEMADMIAAALEALAELEEQ